MADKLKQKKDQPYRCTGRRKEAVARVFLRPGNGKFYVNGHRLEEYFTSLNYQKIVKAPLEVTETDKQYDIKIRINGGGISGQAGAIRLGIARALVRVHDKNRDILKDKGFLTRDPRVKERKKYGKKRARKSFQFSKR